jgi:type VI secretion system secreted protein Hcp
MFDAFLKLDGIEGESPDGKHSKEIELLSYSFGAVQPGTSGHGGGGGSGKVAMQDLEVVKRTDKASPKLFLACCTGEHIKTATLSIRKAGGSQQDYLVVKLSDILVSSMKNGGASEGRDDIPTEHVALNFSKIEVEYKEQKADGSLSGSVKTGYDVKKNQKV